MSFRGKRRRGAPALPGALCPRRSGRKGYEATPFVVVVCPTTLVLRNTALVATDPYLGAVYPTEQLKTFAYVTNTKTKFIIVHQDGAAVKEEELRTLFKRLHNVYVHAVCNPFYDTVGEKKLGEAVRAAVKATTVVE